MMALSGLGASKCSAPGGVGGVITSAGVLRGGAPELREL